MTPECEEGIRDEIMRNLLKLSPGHHHRFKQIYSRQNMDMSLDDIVSRIPIDKIHNALSLVERSVTSQRNRQPIQLGKKENGNVC